MIGKRLLHYEIIEKLGEGGMGEVYRARDTKLGRDVAVKVLPEKVSEDPERRKRFEREARMIAALNHPNIVTLYSVEEDEGRLFLTMELVGGRTLRDAIPVGGVPLEQFFSVALPLVDAVCAAFAQGITHRDLKPANVMLGDEGRLKVLDFGLAKLVQEAKDVEAAQTVAMSSDTREGHVVGTVMYMSPEQVEGKSLDGRSDIFSLGVVFYEMLTGRRPFQGDSTASMISSILRDTPPPVTEVRASLPTHLGRIIRRCLAKDPERRYQTPMDLRNDLRELAEEVDSGEVAVSETSKVSGDRPGADPSARRSVPSDSIVLPGTRRTYRWVFGAIAVVILAGLVFAIAKMRAPGEPATVSSAGPPAKDATVGVIGFENLSDPEDSENLGRVLMGLVTTGLAESGGLSVASTAKVLSALRQVGAGEQVFDASSASEAALVAGADVMLVGQVIRDGERMILTAELVDVGSGNTLGSMQKQAASNSELFELAGAIADEVRDLLGAPAGAAASTDFDLKESLTDSPEAYRRFTAGEEAVRQARYDQAVELYNDAIRIDSTFALAYLRLLLAHTWNGETGKGLEAARHGMRFIDRLPERWQTVYRANVDYYEGHPETAYDTLLRLVESNPDIPDAYNLLGEITTHYARYTDVGKAREYFERALEIDPTFEVVLFHLVDDHIASNDRTALEALIAHYRDLDPTDPRVFHAETAYLVARQQYDAAIARYENRIREGDLTWWDELAFALEGTGNWQRALELSQQAVDRREKGYHHAFALHRRGCARIGLGRIRAGIADIDSACATLKGMGVNGRWADAIVVSYRWLQSTVLLEAGDIDGAVALAERAIQDGPRDTRGYHVLVRAQLRAGRIAEAQAALRGLKAVREGNRSPMDGFDALLGEAELAAAAGDAKAALEALRLVDAMPMEDRMPYIQRAIEGDVKTAIGDADGALAAYRKVFAVDGVLVSPFVEISVLRIPYRYKLARAQEAAGRPAEARRNYEAYLDRWENADLPIPDVEDTRRRLQALKQM